MKFQEKLNNIIKKSNSLLCVGLDTDINKIPKHLFKTKNPVLNFNRAIIDATFDYVCCYKTNIAYYSSLGIYGLKALQQTIKYIHKKYRLPVILDAKRGDIGNTSEQYANEAFEVLDADAVTVNPYLGFDATEPFLKYKDKGIIILCRTSNPSASDFQDLKVEGEELYLKVAKKVKAWNDKYGNCLLVVGATYPHELGTLRSLLPNMFFLVPGAGAQGGDIEKTLRTGLNQSKSGLIIHSARAIIYAGSNNDFAKASRLRAKELKETINKYR